VYPAASLCNHSCNPSASPIFRGPHGQGHGRTIELHATRALAAGDEVLVSYINLEQPRAVLRVRGFDEAPEPRDNGVRRAAAARARAQGKAAAPELRMGKLDGLDDEDLLGSDLPGIDEAQEDISMDTALEEIRAARDAVRMQMLEAEAAKRPKQPERRSFGPEPPAAR
jgi:hypothetical protein